MNDATPKGAINEADPNPHRDRRSEGQLTQEPFAQPPDPEFGAGAEVLSIGELLRRCGGEPVEVPVTGKISDLAVAIYRISRAKGFRSPTREDLDTELGVDAALCKLMLVTTEVAEAAEAIRSKDLNRLGNFGEELADVVIRVLDLAHSTGIDLERVVYEKVVYNASRPVKHGKHGS